MKLNREMAEMILKKLESVQPYPVKLVDRDGRIVAASVREHVGAEPVQVRPWLEQWKAEECRPEKSRTGDSQPGKTEAEAEAEGISCLRVRGRVAGVLWLEQVKEADRVSVALARTVAELMLENDRNMETGNERDICLNDALSVLVGVHPPDTGPILEDLGRLGVDLSVPRTTILIQLSKIDTIEFGSRKHELILDQKQYLYSVKKFLGQLADYFYDRQDFILSDISQKNAVILAVNRKENQEVNAWYFMDLCQRLRESARKDHWLDLHAVVGIQCREFPDYERQYEQLIRRLSSGRLLFGSERQVFMGNSIVLGNMVVYKPLKVRRNIVSYVYGRLLASKMKDVLMETLQTFFQCDLSFAATAQKLYTHRNTLQHRFRKIQHLTGYSVHTADGLLTLRLAMLYYNSLLAEGEEL